MRKKDSQVMVVEKMTLCAAQGARQVVSKGGHRAAGQLGVCDGLVCYG